MAKDSFHQQFKTALIKDRWTITHDPLTIRISEAVKLQIDLAAEQIQQLALLGWVEVRNIRVHLKAMGSDINRQKVT